MSESQNPYAAPAEPTATTEAPANEAINLPSPTVLAEAAKLAQQGKQGTGWFYWVAALTVINCLMIHSGAGRHFVIGLGALVLVDSISVAVAGEQPEMAFAAHAVGIGIDVVVIAMVALCGWLANQRWTVVHGIGMALYLLDGLLFLMMGDIMSVGFHGLALWGMWSGFQAYRKLNQFESALAAELAAAA